MTSKNKKQFARAEFRLERDDGAPRMVLSGHWNLRGLEGVLVELRARLDRLGVGRRLQWDLTAVDALDSAGALVLWLVWGRQLPDDLRASDDHRALFERVAEQAPGAVRPPPPGWRDLFSQALDRLRGAASHARDCTVLFGLLLTDLAAVVARPSRGPWRELSASIHKIGTRALGVTALVGFLIGVVVSYLVALQLRLYGAGELIVTFVGLSVFRELGPMLAAILVAGRSGSAITAELGVMRVTQELDALKSLGISVSRRLLLPRVLAMAVALPLVVLWTNAIAVLGGMTAARAELDISFAEFLMLMPQVVPVASFWIGIGKGLVFGIVIAVVACHFGLRVQPNTESLGRETTNAVVVSITMVIVINAMFAIAFREVGLG